MNDQLSEKFKRGDIVLGKVIEIKPSKALIAIEGCEPVYIIKEVASIQEIESIEEVLQLNKIYEFCIEIDYSARFYKTDEYYLSIAALEYSRRRKRLKQLAIENVKVYSKVINAYDYGVLVNVENEDFLVSNIHLKTQVSNQDLVGEILTLKVIIFQKNGYDSIYISHRWALDSNQEKKNQSSTVIHNSNSKIENTGENKLYALGDIIVGKVIQIANDYALVDIGAEKSAYIALRDMSVWAKSSYDVLHLNLVREFIVCDIHHNQGGLTLGLSIKELEDKIGSKRVEQIQEESQNIILYSQVSKRNHLNNGFIVNIEGKSYYLPDNLVNPNFIKNQEFKTRIPLKLFKYGITYWVSNKLALFILRLKKIKIGDLLTGKVRKIKEYGLAVDIGEGNVLLHISEISQNTVDEVDLNSIFKVDDEIKAVVISMDIAKRRVAVSTKELEIEPGDMLKDPQLVYINAEKMAEKYRSKRENLP